ncbi:conserved hypothetical protein [Tenacibaculum sp. 190524A02b]|uniref:Late control protein n=1 Tax=Tenacibaculum vairaonense TaxID=3137860 RepID=A0ABM9PQZ7_9FLAO
MFILESNIQIGSYTFNQVKSVNVVRDINLLSDTAKIELPASAMFGNKTVGFEKKALETAIKVGDPVQITLGYKDVLIKTVFKGFVTSIYPNQPTIKIDCEDSVYLIRKKNLKKNFIKTSLKEVLQYIVDGTSVNISGNIPEVKFDKFLLKNVNGAKALQKIKDEYGLTIYIDDNNELYAGLKYAVIPEKEVVYNLQANTIKHDLKFTSSDNVRLKIKVIGVRKNNTKITVVVGDDDGEQRTIYRYNITDPKILKEIGEKELIKLKYTGYRGTVTGFFIPFSDRAMKCKLINANFPEREGVYYIPKVTLNFNTSGARFKTELGVKL